MARRPDRRRTTARCSGRIFGRGWRRRWRWGASRWRRRGSAASCSRRSGGSPRLSYCGNGSGWSAASGLSSRGSPSAAVALALAALSALHDSIRQASSRRSFSARPRSAGSPERRQRIWAAAGVLYAGALVASVGLLRVCPSFGMACDSVAVRGRLGSGHRGLFRRPADRRPTALAERLAGQDLVRGDRRRVRRGGPRPHARRHGRTAWRRSSGSGSRRRLCPNLAICSNPRSSGVSASRIRAASFPATAD